MHISTEKDEFKDQHIHWNSKDHKEAAEVLKSHAAIHARTKKVVALHSMFAQEKG